MIYTINTGLRNHVKENLVKAGGIGLPALALIFLIIAALSFSSSRGAGQQPYITAKKTASNFNAASGSGTSSGGSSTSNPKFASQQPAIASQGLPSSVSALSAPLPSTTGSGGSILTGGRGGGDTSGGGGTGGGQPSVACDNLLNLTVQTCTVCLPPLILQPGQKALLSSDGSCTVTN